MRDYIERLENALCMAICIIRNEAGLKPQAIHDRLNRWCDELVAESGINFDEVLMRDKSEPFDDDCGNGSQPQEIN